MAVVGVSGGFAMPLLAEPPQDHACTRAATTGQSSSRIGGRQEVCVVVDVAGNKVGDIDCAAAWLQAAARVAQERAKTDPTLAVPTATSDPLRVGVGSVAASSQRLGGYLRGATSLPVRHAPNATRICHSWAAMIVCGAITFPCQYTKRR